jgi:hypothetical protein
MMKNFTIYYILMAFLICNVSFAQVGIGTSSPKGILDIESSTHGVVYPSVALNKTNVAAPVVNPQGGALAVGTTVYNTKTTSSGLKDVEPGIYSWDGTQWVTHFFKEQSELFEQSSALRCSSSTGFQDIPGLGVGDSKTFVAKYSGLYRLEAKMNYGAGDMVDNGDVNVAAGQGDFSFIFDATTYTISTKSYSTYNANVSGGTYYSNIWVESYITEYVILTAGQTYGFSLQFDQAFGDGFEADGDLSGGLDGRGYIGTDVPCFVEITYIDEI